MVDCERLDGHVPQMCQLTYALAGSMFWSPRRSGGALTGLVDADGYRDNFINFPAHWHDAAFTGVLPKGTPVAQCLPIRRDIWTARFGLIEGDAVGRLQELSRAVLQETGVYRRQFRAPKR